MPPKADTHLDRLGSVAAYSRVLATDFVAALTLCTPEEVHKAVSAAHDSGSMAENLRSAAIWKHRPTADLRADGRRTEVPKGSEGWLAPVDQRALDGELGSDELHCQTSRHALRGEVVEGCAIEWGRIHAKHCASPCGHSLSGQPS